MNFLDVLGDAGNIFKSAADTVVNVASSVADAKFGWASKNLDLKLKNAQINDASNQIAIQKIVSDTSVKIANLQAQNALKTAQYGYDGIGAFNADNITTAIANLQKNVTGQNGTSPIMFYLTLAGVGFAALQYFKSR